MSHSSTRTIKKYYLSTNVISLFEGFFNLLFRVWLFFTRVPDELYFLRIFNPAAISFSLGLSLCTMCVISVDRYIAILHPVWYRINVTSRTTHFIIAGCWIYLCILILPAYIWYGIPVADEFDVENSWPSFLPSSIRVAIIVPNVLAWLIISYVMYALIFCRLKVREKSRSQIAPEIITVSSTADSRPGSNWNSENKSKYLAKQRTKQRVAVTMALTLGALTLSWLPVTIVTIFIDGEEYACSSFRGRIYVCSILLLFMSSAWNPLIYALRMKNFRDAYKKILSFNRCKKII